MNDKMREEFEKWWAQQNSDLEGVCLARDEEIEQERIKAGRFACWKAAWSAVTNISGQGEWQPSETAPEIIPADEAVLVCVVYDEPRFAGQRMVAEAHKEDGIWWFAGTSADQYHADCIEDQYGLGCVTHWRPMPEPPVIESQEV